MLAARQPVPNWPEAVTPAAREAFEAALHDPAFGSCATFREQCSFLAQYSEALTCHQIARIFGRDSKTIWSHVQRASAEVRPHGRPPVLTPDQASAVLSFIQDRLSIQDPPTVTDVLNFVWDNFAVSVIPDTLRKWLNSRTEFKTMQSRPMEDCRLRTTVADIQQYFHCLATAIKDVPSALIFNMDESGFQRFVDSKHETVIVPRAAEVAYHAVSRQEKRATFLLTVAADGRAVKPLVIVPRVTVEAELLLAGYSQDQCVFAHSPNGYITSALFERYVRDIFVPYVNVRRGELGYQGYAVLTLDRCSCHCSQAIQAICDANGIRLVYLPAHSSDQTQACDLGLFGNLKAAQSRIHPPEEMSLQSRQLIRIISAFHAVCHPLAVTSAFRRAGISNVLRDGRLYAEVTPSTCSAIRQPPPEWIQHVPPNRFDKSRIPLGDGLWGAKADWLLEASGIYTFPGQIPDPDDLPPSLGPEEQATLDAIIADMTSDSDEDWMDASEVFSALGDPDQPQQHLPVPRHPVCTSCEDPSGRHGVVMLTGGGPPSSSPGQPTWFSSPP